jgi:exodeoxyribonuclease V gamma subunit
MFHLKVSNTLDTLAKHMGSLLRKEQGNVFNPHYIVTQTQGMNIWLRQQLAEELGIAANIDFRKPNELLVKVYQMLGGPHMRTLSKENITWFLFHLMGQPDFARRFPSQSDYFNLNTQEKQLKRMGLAEKIADLFDQYQIYRPETIRYWNQLDESAPGLDWQAFLWIKVRKQAGEQIPDKTFVSEYIRAQLDDPAQRSRLKELLPCVYLFGLSIITRYHIEILSRIAEVTDVYFYLLNPAPEVYWIDDHTEKDLVNWRRKGMDAADAGLTGNPLLTSWGKVLQHTFRLLFRNESLLNNYDVLEAQIPMPETLLAKIQSDISNNSVAEQRWRFGLNDLQDGSLVIQSNYTIAREVESLYQYLVHLANKENTRLSARDVVVMVSDIDLYAPYIKAIFDNAGYKFRYRIADVSLAQGDNVYSALQAILRLNDQSFTAEAVMQLLDSARIRRRFRISNTDQLRQLVHAAHIRFGIEGSIENETRLVSWQYGLKRMMFGLCMSGAESCSHEADDFFPLDLVEGNDTWEVVRFCHFISVLIDAVQRRKNARSLSEWVLYIDQIVADMLQLPDEEPDEDMRTLSASLRKYNELAPFMDEAVSFEIFMQNFAATLETERRAALFAGDGITFCSLIPMRSIPFRVVAMLGMDYDKFPRKEKSVSFNLITQKHQIGDRNIKDNDKHLFLETLLSAKEYLYISYLGRSVSDNSHRPPSILIEELLHYIQTACPDVPDATAKLVVQQPLHPFSKRYNSGNPGLYYYSEAADIAAELPVSSLPATPGAPADEINFQDIISFYRNSLKAYYNKTLGIYYNREELLLQETEMFEADALAKWSLNNKLLDIDNEKDLSDLRKELVRLGLLPLRNTGMVLLHESDELLAPLRDLIHTATNGLPAGRSHFSLQLDGTLVTGNIPRWYDGKLVHLNWSANIIRNMVEAYLYALAGIASDCVHDLVIINCKGEPSEIAASIFPIDKGEAIQRLEQIVSFYKIGLQKKIVFADCLYSNLKILEAGSDEALKAAINKMISNTHIPLDDPYILKEHELKLFEQRGIWSDFLQAAQLVLEPLTRIFPGHKF